MKIRWYKSTIETSLKYGDPGHDLYVVEALEQSRQVLVFFRLDRSMRQDLDEAFVSCFRNVP